MYALKLSPLGRSQDLLSMETKHCSSSNGADRVSMVFSWVLFSTSLHKGYVLQKLVLSYTKLYISQNSAVHCFHSERCFFICNTNDCISSLGFGGSRLTNTLPGGRRL